jgi:hypothetical protein
MLAHLDLGLERHDYKGSERFDMNEKARVISCFFVFGKRVYLGLMDKSNAGIF